MRKAIFLLSTKISNLTIESNERSAGVLNVLTGVETVDECENGEDSVETSSEKIESIHVLMLGGRELTVVESAKY